VSSPHSRNSVYIKMSETTAYRSENDEERLVREEQEVGDGMEKNGGITVRTDIKVVADRA